LEGCNAIARPTARSPSPRPVSIKPHFRGFVSYHWGMPDEPDLMPSSQRGPEPSPKDHKDEPAKGVEPLDPAATWPLGEDERHVIQLSDPDAAPPNPGRKWVQRAEADRRARARLELLEGEGVIILNDRRVPGHKANIKRIAVSQAGVFVIEAKHYKGLVHTKRPGSIGNLGPNELHVGRRNCTQSVELVAEQRRFVRAALDGSPLGATVPVHAMLCLTRAEWGFATAIQVDGVWVGWPKLAARRVQDSGSMDSPTVREVSEMIAVYLPGA
jgi:hypothetical protein